MEELTDFLTNKWFTSLNQPLLWQKSKYQILAPPVLCALCVHQSSLKTLKTITWQILCLRSKCTSRIPFWFSWNPANSSRPCRQNKKGTNAKSSLNNFHSSEFSDNKGFLGNNHLYMRIICRQNILGCSHR